MIVQYSEETINTLIELFRSGKIAKMSVLLDENNSLGNEYILTYNTIDEYPENIQQKIISNNDKYLGKRISALRMLKAFSVAMEENNVNYISINYDATDDFISYRASYAFKNTDNISAQREKGEEESTNEENIEIPTDTGITLNTDPFDTIKEALKDTNRTGLFSKKNGSGKQRKYVELSVEEVIDALKSLIKEG